MNMLRKIHTIVLSVLLLSGGCLTTLSAQVTMPQLREVQTLVNEPVSWEIYNNHHYQVYATEAPTNGAVDIWGPDNNYGEHTVEYTPNYNFTGTDELTVRYRTGTYPAFYWAEETIIVTVVPAYIKAIDDFTSTQQGQEIIIDVLSNDDWTGSDAPHVEKVTLVNSGTADCTDASCATISFTPDADFTGIAHLNYTICDDDGNCDDAIVNISVSPTVVPQHDSLYIITSRETSKVVLFDLAGYNMSTEPQHGSADFDAVLGVPVYLPNSSYAGFDEFLYEKNENGMLYTRYVNIHVLDVEPANDYLFDDDAYTAEGYSVIIDVSENDKLSPSYYSILEQPEHGTVLPVLVNGDIQYEYTPNGGFTGLDNFVYRGFVAGELESAKVTVHVNNQIPAQPLFALSTLRSVPLVLEYGVPIEQYAFNVVGTGAEHGTVEISAGNSSKSWNGQSTSGYNLITYTPPSNPAVTYDEFEVEYSVNGNPGTATTVKITVDILDIEAGEQACIGDNCVWPGDANRDGIVNAKDVLPIGLCMGEEGIARNAGAVGGQWYGQYASDWNDPFEVPGFDLKHIDTDGDSIISNLDTAAIAQYYGKINSIIPSAEASIALPFYFEEETPNQVYEPGDVVSFNIYLGKYAENAQIAEDIHGLASSFHYLPDFVEPGSVNISFPAHTWMSYDSPTLGFTQDLPTEGKIDFAYTRTNGVSIDGYGLIAKADFVIIEDVLDFRPDQEAYLTIPFSLSGTGIIGADGQSYGLADSGLEIEIHIPAEDEETTVKQDDLRVFPNPTSDAINLYLNGYGNSVSEYTVFDLAGKQVHTAVVNAKSATLNISTWSAGTYFVRATAETGEVITKKFEVVK